ncbi:hypothetical protein [Micromonospora sp. U21]|uniref:hypothetical protein n=1 Tax=Micromonospora sp. U21 TaxID=2824899 RepID=UPI001B36C5BF|nr:hypothetical protein [Micromonospora sp. U21]MBQ0905421.1 hypothetical protein [Micromonospora sp. U21]
MSRRDRERLTNVERAFFVNAFEMDLLAGVFGDLAGSKQEMPLHELTQVLLSLIDRGWIEVRRYDRWIAEDGREGLMPGEAVARQHLPQLLADPATWEYPEGATWVGAITLVETESGSKVSRMPPEEITAQHG